LYFETETKTFIEFCNLQTRVTPHLKIPLVWEVATPDGSSPIDGIRPGLFFHQTKGPPIPIKQQTGWGPQPVWKLREKVSCCYWGLNPGSSVRQPVAWSLFRPSYAGCLCCQNVCVILQRKNYLNLKKLCVRPSTEGGLLMAVNRPFEA
jgi:hypothetical protein